MQWVWCPFCPFGYVAKQCTFCAMGIWTGDANQRCYTAVPNRTSSSTSYYPRPTTCCNTVLYVYIVRTGVYWCTVPLLYSARYYCTVMQSPHQVHNCTSTGSSTNNVLTLPLPPVLDTAVLRTTTYVLCVVSHCYCYCSSRRGVLLTEIIYYNIVQLFDVVFVCFTTIENIVLQILSLVLASSFLVVVLVYCRL